MAKTTTETITKAATKAANAKTTRPKKASEKPKRAPSAYQKYVGEQIKIWRAENPDRDHREAMKAVAVKWRDAPENPNRGQDPKQRKAKAKAVSKKAKAIEEDTASGLEGSDD